MDKDIRFASPEAPALDNSRIPTAVIAHDAQPGHPPVLQVKIGVINEVLHKKSAPAIHPGNVQADLMACSAWCGNVHASAGEDWFLSAEWWLQQAKRVCRNRYQPAIKEHQTE